MKKARNLYFLESQSIDTGPHLTQATSKRVIGPHIVLRQLDTEEREDQKQKIEMSFENQSSLSKSKSSETHSSSILNSLKSSINPFGHSPTLNRESGTKKTIKFDKKLILQNGQQLKQIITQLKIKQLVNNFINKISQNNIYSRPVDYTPFFKQEELSFFDSEGIVLNDFLSVLISLFSTLLIVGLTIIYTLSIVFDEVDHSILLKVLQAVGLIFYLFELGLNLVTVKFDEGKRLGTLRSIFNYCLKNTLTTDLVSIIIIIIDLMADIQGINYIRLFTILKLSNALEKLEKVQIFFIHNFHYEQYWSLVKVFIFNFSLAHFLAIFLVAMAGISPDDNWMNYKDINSAPWVERYAWAYYWATTIMLTVGFGDLSATNYQEAIVLTMIEMISCITLAYNINCVGTLISNIRSQDLQKGKNFKIFYKLSRKNDISQDLEWRINNYIEESSNIKKKFNHEQEGAFVQKLPNGLKSQFLKESHKKIFYKLPFFQHLMQRTLFNFAQKIEMHICHPEEIIQHIDDPHNLLILKGGEIGLTCKKNGCDFNSTIVERMKPLNLAEPLLISLGFINKPRSIYEIKSLEYSILYFMDFEKILAILKESEMDYELYCILRDKTPKYGDQFELLPCEICQKNKHTKFTCPKLHFMPFKEQIIGKYIYNYRNGKSERDKIKNRFNAKQYSSLKIYKRFNLMEQSPSQKEFMMEIQKESEFINVLKKKGKYQKIEEQQTENILIKQISDIKDFFSKNAAELIKHEVSKAFKDGQGRDDVWIIETDKVKNYKSYFEGDNSCNLKNRFYQRKRGGAGGSMLMTLTKLPKVQDKIYQFSSPFNDEKEEGTVNQSMKSMKEFMSYARLSYKNLKSSGNGRNYEETN